MFVGKVIGNVWATRKHKELEGATLLLVRPEDSACSGDFTGDAILALDGVGAGPGDVVLVMDEGGGARKILRNPKAPVRTVICGIVDQVSCIEGVKKYA